MRRTLAGLLIAAVCATSAIAAQSKRAAPAPGVTGDFDVTEQSIADLQSAMGAGLVTSHALVVMYEARIRAYDHDGPRLNAMVAINPRASTPPTRSMPNAARVTFAARCTASRSS